MNALGQERGSFYTNIERDFGTNMKLKLKNFATNNNKLAHLSARKCFLLKCRKNNVIPKHILVNVNCVFPSLEENTPYSKDIGNLICNFRKRILNLEIKIAFWKIKQLEQLNKRLKDAILSANIPQLDAFFRTQEIGYNNSQTTNHETLNKKFTRLYSQQIKPHINANVANFVHKSTDTQIPDDVMFLLGLGPKFGLPCERVPTERLIAETECIMRKCVEPEQRNNIRYDLTLTLSRAMRTQALSTFDKFLLDKKKKCIAFAKDHPNIICVRSDKGGKTVFMDRDSYTNKANEMLSDTNTYGVIRDPTSRIQRVNNNFVLSLFRAGKIDDRIKRQLTTYNAVPPRLYLLPKHHKKEYPLPLRPISSELNGPITNLSRFAAGILSRLTKSKFYLRNSYEFKEFISTQRFDVGQVQVSFDVKSLFTNAPINRIHAVIESRWNEIAELTNLSQIEFMSMIKICTSNSYFKHNDRFYSQKEGCPMGSSISCILVEILMDSVLERAVKMVKEKLNFSLNILKKYVDDLYLVIPSNLLSEIHNIFNGIEAGIEFTYEEENGAKLPFLDMVVIRDVSNGNFITDWYRKEVSSGRQLNFKSIHPMNQKISTAAGLIDRIFKLSDQQFHVKNTQMAYDILTANDYPKPLISRIINRFKNKTSSQLITQTLNNSTAQITATSKTFALPYIPSVSTSIARSIKQVADVRFAYKSNNSVSSLFTKLKDKIPNALQSNLVYQVDCLDCDKKKCYIGMTSQHLEVRMDQHEKSVKNGKPEKSALAYHAITNNHNFDFENVKILERESNFEKRALLEEIYIKSSKNCVNKKSIESKNVNDIYSKLF